MKTPYTDTTSAECALLLARGRLTYYRDHLDKYASYIPKLLMEIQRLEDAIAYGKRKILQENKPDVTT